MHRSGYAVVIDGWANDRDTTTPVVVHVRVDNARVANATANQPTPTHGHRGFSIKVPLTSGPHGVCVRAQNSPDSSQNSLLGCRTINYNYNPKGDFQLVQTPGALTATGWAIDFDAPRQTIGYAIRMDHNQVAHGAANAVDNALSTQFKSAGVNHGFSVTFPVTEGTHRVCLQVFNLGQGSNTIPKCFDPLEVNFSPTGSVTSLGQVPGGISIGGYALDPDTTAATGQGFRRSRDDPRSAPGRRSGRPEARARVLRHDHPAGTRPHARPAHVLRRGPQPRQVRRGPQHRLPHRELQLEPDSQRHRSRPARRERHRHRLGERP